MNLNEKTMNGNLRGSRQSDIERVPLGDRYLYALTSQTEGAHGEGKGERTRAKLKLAAFTCLSQTSVNNVTVSAITSEAKVASGTFYIHFAGVREIILEVFSEFAALDIRPALPTASSSEDLFSEMKEAFLIIVRGFRERRTFYRSIFQFAGQDADANRIWIELSKGWGSTLSEFASNRGRTPLPTDVAGLLGHASTGAVDELMRRIYIDQIYGEEFIASEKNDEFVAEFLAFMRYRMLLGEDPMPSLLKRNRG